MLNLGQQFCYQIFSIIIISFIYDLVWGGVWAIIYFSVVMAYKQIRSIIKHNNFLSFISSTFIRFGLLLLNDAHGGYHGDCMYIDASVYHACGFF